MTTEEAKKFVEDAVKLRNGVWADIGAGTGTYTMAFFELLEGGTLYAVDKNPHALWSLQAPPHITFRIEEGDFDRPLPLPEVDGILLANTLHYSDHPEQTLKNILKVLKPGGQFILIEYDLDVARPPWIPFPIEQTRAFELCDLVGLTEPTIVNRKSSMYGQADMYCALSTKR